MIARTSDLVVTSQGARFLGRVFPCSLGRGGIGKKSGEGDAITPLGCWRLTHVLFRPERVTSPAGCLPTGPVGLFDIWSDDPEDRFYNKMLRAFHHPFSHERLRRSDPLYDIVVTTNFNTPKAVPGGGSAIFLHVWRAARYPTAGCIAFRAADLRWILARWRDQSRLVIAGRDRFVRRK